MRREQLVVEKPFTSAELRAACDPGHLVRVLVRREGNESFVRLGDDESVVPNDEVVIYDIDTRRDEELRAANALFNASYYVGVPPGPWPDEERVIRELVPPAGARVLEVCCGSGRLGGALIRDDNRVLALDASLACLRHARAHDASGVVYFAGDALQLPFRDGAFDVACMFENSLGILFGEKSRALDESSRVARCVILGLRDDGPEKLHVYESPDGYLELAETFTLASVTALLDRVSAERRPRILRRSFRPGSPRPWGGRQFFVVLALIGA